MASLLDKFPNWQAQDRTNSMSARLFNGSVGFSVFPRDRNAGREPVLRISFDKDGVALQSLIDMIDAIGKAPLGQKMQMSRTQYDPQTKTRKTLWVLALEKDSEMCYHITITEVATNKMCKMPITVSQSVLVGSEQPSKSELSARGMKLFKKWLVRAEQFAPLTIDPTRQFGGGGQRPGAQRPSGYQAQGHVPQSPAVAPSVSGDPEDIPF